ncbi:MAG: 16S rRNA (uracil(1498)-N(3))-methyltransferase [Angelakisella sp.]
MPRFFTTDINQTTGTITGEDARHISKALRCKVGEELVACDGMGNDYQCRIADMGDTTVTLTVLSSAPSRSEPPVSIRLFQALPKADKLELIVQKAVELGVTTITPVLTERCVSRPDGKAMEKKLERLNRISLEAAKQSGRGVIPQVTALLSLREALAEMKQAQEAILFYENATAPLGTVLAERPRTISLLIGAEGGFSEAEVAEATAAGLHVCTMGSRILRCETAPMYALSAITYEYENRR